MPNSESAAQLALRLLPVPLSGPKLTAGADRPAPARLPNSTVPGTWSQGPALAGGLPLRLTHPASLRSGQLAWAGTLGGRAVPLKLAAGCAIQAASVRGRVEASRGRLLTPPSHRAGPARRAVESPGDAGCQWRAYSRASSDKLEGGSSPATTGMPRPARAAAVTGTLH